MSIHAVARTVKPHHMQSNILHNSLCCAKCLTVCGAPTACWYCSAILRESAAMEYKLNALISVLDLYLLVLVGSLSVLLQCQYF
jgi:hypothetical protein